MPKNNYVNLEYINARHRYWPKLSKDGLHWADLDSSRVVVRGNTIQLKLPLTPDTLWVSGQELFTTEHLKQWLRGIESVHEKVRVESYGKSTLNRALYTIHLYSSRLTNRKLVVLMSWQHPPEVTGQLAILHFVERLLEKDSLTNALLRWSHLLPSLYYPMVRGYPGEKYTRLSM